jgi:molecular chaperone DnaK
MIAPYIDRSVQACGEVLAAAGLDASQLNELILVGGSTRTPLVRSRVEQQFRRKPQSRVNPDETVACGAALQGAALSSGHADPAQFYSLLLDVAPRALGIAVAGGYNETIVERNTPIPVERTRKFITSKDFQTRVDIHVSQGEEKMFAANEKLGTLELHGLAPAKRGETEIEVTFTIDVDGILNVRAVDSKTRKETQAAIRVIGAPTEEARHAAAAGPPTGELPSPA